VELTLVSIRAEVRRDIKSAQKVRAPGWALVLVIIVGVPVFLLIDQAGLTNISLPIFDSFVAFGFVVYVKRKLFPRWWFWATMAPLALLHALLICAIPWSGAWKPAALAGAVVSVDICLMLWILATVEALMRRKTAARR
jgi:hypothetical protein